MGNPNNGNVLDFIKDSIDYIKGSKERKEREAQMKQDLARFDTTFDTLSLDEKEGIIDVARFLMEDGSTINITLEDKEKESVLRKMSIILQSLPGLVLAAEYSQLSHKLETQKQLLGVLKEEKPTEYEDAPEDEAEHQN